MNAFAAKSNLGRASRFPNLSRAAGVSMAEIACLLACGAMAALAIGLLTLSVPVPGHAILRGVLPMALGLAVVPRRSAGTVMSLGAGLTAAAMSWGHVGRFQPGAILGILALGPILDVALAGKAHGWQLYARFAAAGMLANLLAFAARFGTAFLGWELSRSRQFTTFWSVALMSFILCGALAGLVSAAICFRMRADDDLRRT